jgi:hypothetical protein
MTDNCRDWTPSTAFMVDDPGFVENPIGVSVDPARMAAARSGGESAEELHARASRVEFHPHRPLDAHVRLG